MLKVDNEGSVLWDKTLGGTSADGVYTLELDDIGNVVLAGYSTSDSSEFKSEDSIGPNGDADYWIVKLDSSGNLIWEKTIGGESHDFPEELIVLSNNSVLVGGHSLSNIGGHKSENNFGSGEDYWLVWLDEEGNFSVDETIGGNDNDELYTITEAHTDGFLMAGRSISNASGDKSEDRIGGNYDYWVVKLGSDSCTSYGCLDPLACNFNSLVDCDDGTCEFEDACGDCGGTGIGGCTDPDACNFNSQATCEDNSCTYIAFDYLNCQGECINDTDNDGVCDEIEVIGCLDPSACNFDPLATESNPATCFFATAVYDCNGNCQQDSDGDGICDQNETNICQGPECCGEGTIWNPVTLQCEGYDNCTADLNDDGTINSGDLLLFLAVYNTDCPPSCLNDTDGDGICDEDEIVGCTDTLAMNYDPEATDDDGSCLYFEIGLPFGGGTIGYIFQPGDIGYVEGEIHGIILADESQSTGATWGCYGQLIGGTQLQIGTGGTNHQLIIQNCGNTGNAAWLCQEYSVENYNDWVLPSFGELMALFLNKDQIGFNTEARYWSSSESSGTTAFNVWFNDGSSCVCDKLSIAHVRAIRYF